MRYERPKNPLHQKRTAHARIAAAGPAATVITDRMTFRHSPASGRLALRVTLLLWLVVVGLILRQRIFISNDTISNYAHVWYVSDRVRATGMLPFHMPVLGHGQAFAFPYSFLPWLSAALIWPVFGEWSVTLMLVAGCAALIAAMLWALPELRADGWLATAALCNPALVAAPIVGQLPFLWATAMLFVAIGAWRRDRRGAAIIAAGIAQATHPAVVAPIAIVLVLVSLIFETDRARLMSAYLISGIVAVPAAAMVLFSPVIADTSRSEQLREFTYTFATRCPVVFVPLLLVAVAARAIRAAPLFVIAMLVSNIALAGYLDTSFGWRHLLAGHDNEIADITNGSNFEPGATYRVLDANDGKYSMYRVLRRGGNLDSELFPESIGRHSFSNPEQYTTFLKHRRVGYVIVFDRYDHKYKTNEHAELEQLTDTCNQDRIGARLVSHHQHHWLYEIDYTCRRR